MRSRAFDDEAPNAQTGTACGERSFLHGLTGSSSTTSMRGNTVWSRSADGRTLRTLEILDAKWCAPLGPEALQDALVGRRVERLARRGKYLIWEASDEVFLLMHLRMTGTILYDAPAGALYTRVRLALDDG